MTALPTCSCCGQRLIPPGLVLPPTKRRILDAVRRRPGINSEALRAVVWAADPSGGPSQLNRLLQPHGIRVRGSVSGGYRVENAEEIVP